jgi:hypothetical protein
LGTEQKIDQKRREEWMIDQIVRMRRGRMGRTEDRSEEIY